MTDQSDDPGHEHHEADTVSHATSNGGSPTETLVAGAVGDRCVNCGTPLSSDQRYCVVCGERRGSSRFSMPVAPTEEQPAPTAITRGGRRGLNGGTGFGPGATLIAGVATLLLAMLVGVLIGHNTANTKTVASNNDPVRVITVNAGESAPSPSTSASIASTPSSSSHKKSGTASKAKKSAKAPVSKATASKESSAASKVTGGSGGVPATVTVGAKGSGPGYSKKTHKFNGSFFGQ